MADVTGLISDAQGYTTKLVGQATTAMNAAVAGVEAVGMSLPNYNGVNLTAAPPNDISPELPTFAPVLFVPPPPPSPAPIFQDVSPLVPGLPPINNARLIPLVPPTRPDRLAEFRYAEPRIKTDITFPEPPDELLHPNIPVPILTDHEVPLKPQVRLPSFDSVAPTLDATAPTDLDQVLATQYAAVAPSFVTAMDGYVDAMLTKRNPQYAAQMAAIEAQLTKYLQGGTGLNPTVEDAIYERARSKANAEASRVRAQAWDEAASRGFTIPNGALLSAVQTARQAGADTNAAGAREIVVMQAEMEQKNLQFAVTTSTGLRTALLSATLSYHQNLVSINGQALDYAKSVMTALIETYNTAVKAFTAKLEGYKADAVVFETKLKGAMAYIELYTAEIKALEAMISVDKARVDVYRARIETLSSLANVYRSQIDAVQGRTNLEKLKLEVFQAQVQTYSAQVQAKNAEWQGYSAAITGEEVKVRAYSAEVQAFIADVGGYTADIQAKSEVIKATTLTNQSRASQFQSQLSAYQAVVQTMGEKARTELSVASQTLNAFQAKIQAEIGQAQVQQGYYRAASEIAISNATGNFKAQIGQAESKRAYVQTIAQLGTANANIYGNLAGSAMSGMNTLVSQSAATSA